MDWCNDCGKPLWKKPWPGRTYAVQGSLCNDCLLWWRYDQTLRCLESEAAAASKIYVEPAEPAALPDADPDKPTIRACQRLIREIQPVPPGWGAQSPLEDVSPWQSNAIRAMEDKE